MFVWMPQVTKKFKILNLILMTSLGLVFFYPINSEPGHVCVKASNKDTSKELAAGNTYILRNLPKETSERRTIGTCITEFSMMKSCKERHILRKCALSLYSRISGAYFFLLRGYYWCKKKIKPSANVQHFLGGTIQYCVMNWPLLEWICPTMPSSLNVCTTKMPITTAITYIDLHSLFISQSAACSSSCSNVFIGISMFLMKLLKHLLLVYIVIDMCSYLDPISLLNFPIEKLIVLILGIYFLLHGKYISFFAISNPLHCV